MNDQNRMYDIRNILIWLILGAIVGWIAAGIVGTTSSLVTDILVGIAGSFIGGWIMGRLGRGKEVMRPGEFFSWRGFLTALLGAIVLLVIVKILS
jgi:uncharacterized membrane protein YeaQ/YmgE (transglycosylase-associated protein family)